MRQGTDRAALKERKDDLNETPPCATRALIRAERLPHAIWEPCAGRGAIAAELRRVGHAVAASDLVAYENQQTHVATSFDFLMEWQMPLPFPYLGEKVAAIVTNPPYKLADEFIRHGLSFDIPVIVLLRLAALEGAGRSDIIDRHLVRVWLGIERLPFMHREGWTGKKQEVSTQPFAWFVFDPQPHDISTGFCVQRVSWRESASVAAESPLTAPVHHVA